MQETYVRAYQHLGAFAGQAKFSTWLTKIAIHESFSRMRRFVRTSGPATASDQDSAFESTMPSKERDPEAQTYDHELRSVLENAISALPDAYRSVFVLRVVEGLSINETAAALDVGVETVKTRLHRGRALLRKTLQRRAGIVAQEIFPFHASRCDSVVSAVMRVISPR
jgi:RNA polymerase sigma-70 factor (ECF subfamily)